MIPEAFESAVDRLRRLPGIGKTSARRIVFHLLDVAESEVEKLGESLLKARRTINLCDRCFALTEDKLCKICQEPTRTSEQLCVVERPEDVFTLEESGDFNGRYHVLRGLISPLDGVGPEQLTIRSLLGRIHGNDETVREVIFAFNPNNEGEVTMNYLNKRLQDTDVDLSHLGYGLPVGSDMEYADRMTLAKAFENRVDLEDS